MECLEVVMNCNGVLNYFLFYKKGGGSIRGSGVLRVDEVVITSVSSIYK